MVTHDGQEIFLEVLLSDFYFFWVGDRVEGLVALCAYVSVSVFGCECA